jgi:hypothetical protein
MAFTKPLPARTGQASAYATGWGETQQLVLRPRMIISVRGEEREGKTQFALSAPGPVAVFPFDNNTREIVNKLQKANPGKKFLTPTESLEYKDASNQGEHEALWQRFISLYNDAVASTSIRSIVVDTGSDLYELARLALLGRLEQVPPHFYGKVNVQFFELIKKLHPRDKNFVITHRLKDEYIKSGKDSARSGVRVLAGVQDVKYKSQLNVICWRDIERRDEEAGTQGFGITIENCTQNETLAGTYLEEPENTFIGLGMRVYSGTSEKDWA